MALLLSLSDLSLWTAVTAIILLVSSEILSPYYGRTEMVINYRRLRIMGLVIGFIFLVTVIFRVYQIVTHP